MAQFHAETCFEKEFGKEHGAFDALYNHGMENPFFKSQSVLVMKIFGDEAVAIQWF